MAARKRIWTPDVVRQRIRTTMLLKRIQNHAFGEVEMTQTQLKAAEILLRKALPDLSAVEHSGEVTNRQVIEISTAELEAIAAGSRPGITQAQEGSTEPPAVH